MSGVEPSPLDPETCAAIARGFAPHLRISTLAFAAAYGAGHSAPPETRPETARLLTQLLTALAVPRVIAYRGDQEGRPLPRLRFYPERLLPEDDMPLHRRLMELLPRRGFRGALTIHHDAYEQALAPLFELSARYCEAGEQIWLRAGDRPVLLRFCRCNDVHILAAGVRTFLPITAALKSIGAGVLFF